MDLEEITNEDALQLEVHYMRKRGGHDKRDLRAHLFQSR